MTVIAPGATIGILGGGQLGRMLAIAAARLGYRVHIFAPEDDPPAADVAADHTRAAYDDEPALAALAQAVAVVTYEFENVPARAVEFLSARTPTRPDGRALAVAQDRLTEKSFLRGIGIRTAPFADVSSRGDFAPALAATGIPAILKTRREGYDGKGQRRVAAAGELEAAWDALGRRPSILEGVVAFEREISVVAARGADGGFVPFAIPENAHTDGILRTSRVPAEVAPATADAARAAARAAATALDYVGVLAIEFFVLADGAVVASEIAPRVHNSGHWTIDACRTDQFEQHIRAICGLPLGDPGRHSDAEMTNLLGAEAAGWAALAADPAVKLHLYGKRGPAPAGRKVGHVTRLKPLGSRPEPEA
jgi:5-(carboxyamino)imidazole ribonucleotide synthase